MTRWRLWRHKETNKQILNICTLNKVPHYSMQTLLRSLNYATVTMQVTVSRKYFRRGPHLGQVWSNVFELTLNPLALTTVGARISP